MSSIISCWLLAPSSHSTLLVFQLPLLQQMRVKLSFQGYGVPKVFVLKRRSNAVGKLTTPGFWGVALAVGS